MAMCSRGLCKNSRAAVCPCRDRSAGAHRAVGSVERGSVGRRARSMESRRRPVDGRRPCPRRQADRGQVTAVVRKNGLEVGMIYWGGSASDAQWMDQARLHIREVAAFVKARGWHDATASAGYIGFSATGCLIVSRLEMPPCLSLSRARIAIARESPSSPRSLL
jgi:hypothetical protein